MLRQPSGSRENFQKEGSVNTYILEPGRDLRPRPPRPSHWRRLSRLAPMKIPRRWGKVLQGGLPERSVVPVPRVALATLNTGVLVLALITKTTTT